MNESFWDRVQKRAYFKHLSRQSNHIQEDSYNDWVEACREEALENKIEEEAFLNFCRGEGDDPLLNWEHARHDVMDRLRFLAFYLHEKDINKSPEDNWVEAEGIYIENF